MLPSSPAPAAALADALDLPDASRGDASPRRVSDDDAAHRHDVSARAPPPPARREKPAMSVFVGKSEKYGGDGVLPESKRLRVVLDRVGYAVPRRAGRLGRFFPPGILARNTPPSSSSTPEPPASDAAHLRLLHDVSAVFEPGEVSALMGPSGAGKTTLLDVVSGRKTAGVVSGSVFFGASEASKPLLESVAAYVEQFDALLGVLTVKETLRYQAELKADPREDPAKRSAYVDRLIELLKLRSCEDVVVGDALRRKISGGEAKRCNIGVALVTRPRVLFLDEPTSGLDSRTSCDVVDVMRALAQSGVTVLATIHSPSSEAFAQFDAVLMLKRGRVAFAGPLGNAVEWFDRTRARGAATTVMSGGVNLADFLIDEVASDAVEYPDEFARSDERVANDARVRRALADAALKGSDGAPPGRLLSSALAAEGILDESVRSSSLLRPKPTAFRAVWTLLKYRTRANYSSAKFLAQRSAGSLIFSLVLSSMYAGQGSRDAPDLANQLNVASLLFMCSILPAYAAAGNMPSIVLERPLFYRERADGCYPALAYVAYKCVEEALVGLPVTLLGQATLWRVVELRGSFFRYWLVYWLTQQTGVALAYFCASVAADMNAANTLLPVYNTCQLLFSGLLIRRADVARGWAWWTRTLFVRYAWQAQLTNHFGRRKAPGVFLEPNSGEMQSVDVYYGADVHAWGENVACIVACWVAWLALTALALEKIKHGNR